MNNFEKFYAERLEEAHGGSHRPGTPGNQTSDMDLGDNEDPEKDWDEDDFQEPETRPKGKPKFKYQTWLKARIKPKYTKKPLPSAESKVRATEREVKP